MSDDKSIMSQISADDLRSMRAWFKSHRGDSVAARTLEEYVELIRYALNNNDHPFLNNAIRFFQKIGEPGFDTIRAIPDLSRLIILIK